MTIYEEIAAERARQVAKGYTAEHDDRHTEGELAELERLDRANASCEALAQEARKRADKACQERR